MRKTTKNVQATKGNLKISNFFVKQEKCNAKTVTDADSSTLANSTNEVLKCDKTIPLNSKRKLNNIHTSGPPKKKSNCNVFEELTSESKPSTSEYNKTPDKKIISIISVKSPEQLLSPEALLEFNTPEKKVERFMEKIKFTPKKILFNEETASSVTSGNPDSLLSSVDNFTNNKKIRKATINESTSIHNKSPKSAEKTPSKIRKTPKKLFNRSPSDISKFNVKTVENFVKVTPSKSRTKDPDVILVTSSEKRQCSILKYFSPSASPRSLEAQKRNESTPTKCSPGTSNSFLTPSSKVKTKLNFSTCRDEQPSSSKVEAEQTLESPKNVKSPKLNNDWVVDTPKILLSPTLSKGCKKSEQENDLNITNLDFHFDDDWHEEILLPSQLDYNLDLTESQHCKIVDKNILPTKIEITLKSTKSDEKALCILEGFWLHSELNVGDIVHITAKKLNEFQWIVNNEYGLLVYEPDLLISSTSVVRSLWCKRRSVLTDYFHGFEPGNEAMLLGSLVHNLLQSVLKDKLYNEKEIDNVARDLINNHSTISSIYECGVTIEHITKELLKFVPKISSFVQLYVKDSGTKRISSIKHKENDWKGTINAIDDIEENIWCPELGIKGKVDVSVKCGDSLMPLELKTGRASVSLEHRGQVLMYIMMMNKLGYKVPSGLLLYLREGVLKEISQSQTEKRDIMLMRNELAYYLTRKTKVIEDEQTKTKKLFPPQLPEPINHRGCGKCPYNVICTSYAKYNNEDISNMKALKAVQDEVFNNLQDSHLNYFMHWVSLIALESNTKKGSKDLREIYTLPPERRENNGKCIINLKISHIGQEHNGVIEHTFERIQYEVGFNFFTHGIMESNYVVVSIASRPAISAGFVTDITKNSITVALDRNLGKKYKNQTFYIDSYDSNSISSYNLTSLTLLLELTSRGEKLRKIVIDRVPPTFKTHLSKTIGTKGKDILKRLNVVQQRAVLKAIAANDYFLIKGMPGTGKTATIVALIQLLVELGKSVLITSHTHSAVDNVCLRLVRYGVKLLRLGSETRIHPNLKEYSENSLTRHCTTPEELETVYNSAQVLAVTCLGSSHPILSKRVMDICVVDESTQVLQCSVIRPLHSANTFILIGDPDQLPAVVQNREALEMGMSESLFERLYTKDASVALNLNYRMNTVITSLANYLTYNGELLIGSDTIANATLKLPQKEVLESAYKHYQWLIKALDESMDNSVQFLDTGPIWNLQHTASWNTKKVSVNPDGNENQSCDNIYESAIVFHLVKALLKGGVESGDIGVIAPFRAQVAQILFLLQADGVDVSTVDQFQGKDKNVIIYSSSKSRDVSLPRGDNKFELLEDKRRLTVAITRAKHKLVVVGDILTLKEYSTFKQILPQVENNLIKLHEVEGFNWDEVLDGVKV